MLISSKGLYLININHGNILAESGSHDPDPLLSIDSRTDLVFIFRLDGQIVTEVYQNPARQLGPWSGRISQLLHVSTKPRWLRYSSYMAVIGHGQPLSMIKQPEAEHRLSGLLQQGLQ